MGTWKKQASTDDTQYGTFELTLQLYRELQLVVNCSLTANCWLTANCNSIANHRATANWCREERTCEILLRPDDLFESVELFNVNYNLYLNCGFVMIVGSGEGHSEQLRNMGARSR